MQGRTDEQKKAFESRLGQIRDRGSSLGQYQPDGPQKMVDQGLITETQKTSRKMMAHKHAR